MSIKVAIFGAGWYGCHLAASLLEKGLKVQIFEKNEKIFNEASKNNQNRLHLGFHYPRSSITRNQSKRGFQIFNLCYKEFIKKIDLNIYSIAENTSLIDFETFKQIMTASKLEFEDISGSTPIILNNIEGSIFCQEMLIDSKKAEKYFLEKLKDSLIFNYKITKVNLKEIEQEFDLILDCTWNKIFPDNNFCFEPSVLFKYEKTNKLDLALTIMDGKLCSIYPYNENFATLSDVEYTPINKCKTIEEANLVIKNISQRMIKEINHKMEEKIKYYFPSFNKNFVNPMPIFSVKTKTRNNYADHRYSFINKINDKIF